ncbi:MAG: hypothetical protein LBP75_11265 [Planctomycetota bacterium]|nr:hypothetical protein [Planctomycetota bacterium]
MKRNWLIKANADRQAKPAMRGDAYRDNRMAIVRFVVATTPFARGGGDSIRKRNLFIIVRAMLDDKKVNRSRQRPRL